MGFGKGRFRLAKIFERNSQFSRNLRSDIELSGGGGVRHQLVVLFYCFRTVSGCLLPSLPSYAILHKTLGISFVCDLNDNSSVPWPSMYLSPASLCKKSVRIPGLPVVASGKISFRRLNIWSYLLLAASMILQVHYIYNAAILGY